MDFAKRKNWKIAYCAPAQFEEMGDLHGMPSVLDPDVNIQGDGFKAEMSQKNTNPTIKNEANNGLKNKTYTIAMARTPAPDSASSQFFINIADNDFLNFTSPTSQGWGYCVFGKVVAGTEVVDKIAKVKTGSKNGHQDVPAESVIIERAEVC